MTISRRDLLVGAGALAAAGGVLGVATPSGAAAQDRFPMPTEEELAVLVTGDAGTGTDAQYAVAAAARAVCVTAGVGLAVGLGDNIYENGPESADDDEFASKFETPNEGIDVPWLMVLGNHDTSGIIPGSGGRPSRGDHEVAYHQRSRRWYMPSRYYRVPVGDPLDPVVEFFALDTTPLASYVMQTDPYYYWDGPFARAQRAWLTDALATSRARWKIVLAHHPLRNNGTHGNAGAYDGVTVGNYTSGVHVKKLYEEVACGRADFILSGHDHSLQLLDTAATYKGTKQIVCGAAAKTNARKPGTPTNKAFWESYDTLGFMIMRIGRSQVAVDAYTLDPGATVATLRHTQVIP